MINNFVTGIIMGFIVALGWFLGWGVVSSNAQINLTPEKAVELRMQMRELWEDHIVWTRMYIVSAAYNNKDTKNIAARLLRNQEDIGNAIKPYYGVDAGNKLTRLLKDHISGAVELVKAAKLGDREALSKANEKWYANADVIADFLSTQNPNWQKNQTRLHMREHLNLTKQEAVDVLGNKFDAGIADYDKVHNQILKMADFLSEGIIEQFPNKF